MYNFANGPNPGDVAKNYQEGLTKGLENQAGMINLANQKQQFGDQQAARLAQQQAYNPQTGQMSQDVLMNSNFAKQNPGMAQNLSNSIKKVGLEGTQLKNEEFKNAYAEMNDQGSYEKVKQGLVDSGHPEVKDWPDYYSPSLKQRGLMGSMTADQQLQLQATQRQNAFGILQKYAEKGVGAPEEIRQMAGFPPAGQDPQNVYHQESLDKAAEKVPGIKSIYNLKPGEVQPMGEQDAKGVAAYRDSLKARSLNDPSYATAGGDLYAHQKMMGIYDKYKQPDGSYDFDAINTQDAHTLALEGAKLKKGGTPTEDEVAAELPPGMNSKIAQLKAKGFSGPVPMHEGDFYKGQFGYANDIQSKAMNSIQKAHQQAEMAARTTGISDRSLAMEKQGMAQELQGKASGSYQPPKAQMQIPDGRITVVDPQGNVGHIPRSQLKQALSQGYKQQK
jgi:hypothetical protein